MNEIDTTGAELIAKIKAHLNAGGQVMTVIYARATIYNKKHVEMFKVGKDGSPLVQRGKHWDSIKYTPVKFSKLA